MGLFGKISLGAMAVTALLADSVSVCASFSFYEASYQVPEEAPEDYTVLEEDLGEYEVCEGDCLWKIAEDLLGSGETYLQLVEMNPDVITDPNLIYPHTCLRVKRNVYIKKETRYEGIRMGPCRFGALSGCTVGITQSGDAHSSFAFTRSDHAQIVCRIRDKEQVSVDTLSDWEKCREAIEQYMEEQYGDRISDLTFQRYRSERGYEIYQFSYTYTVMGEAYGLRGILPVYVSHGICQTEHIQAEFVGHHTEEGMEDVIRYLVADFEELSASGSEAGSMNDYNITMGPSTEWALPGVFNSVGWIEKYYDGIFHKAFPAEPEERSARDRIFNSGGK